MTPLKTFNEFIFFILLLDISHSLSFGMVELSLYRVQGLGWDGMFVLVWLLYQTLHADMERIFFIFPPVIFQPPWWAWSRSQGHLMVNRN